MLNISQIPQKLYLAERFVQKVVTNRLPEKCPNMELFLVLMFLYSDWIQENKDQK